MDQMMSDDRGLARAIGRVLPDDSDTELVLIVDQFEELFTHTDAEHAFALRIRSRACGERRALSSARAGDTAGRFLRPTVDGAGAR